MRLTATPLAAGVLALALSSCAGSYRQIRPATYTRYQSVSPAGAPVEFSYQFSALQLAGGNRKYIKKERKRGYQTVAVRVKNNTSTDLNFSRDLELYFGERPTIPVPAIQAANDMKQGVAIYVLYFLGIGQVGGTYDPYTGQTTGGTLLPWGPIVGAGNMIGAATANSNMRKEFVSQEMTNKIIRPGETVYGIISLREMNVAPLRLQLRGAAAAAPTAVPAEPAAPAAPATTVPASGGQ
ncbi:hypothetical protein LJ737_13815 [Hymenobacter sp. 15J16-1T3B]|uniref:hypothetical protein n=1 Tax=Hymenobacter sp. 15J16-1T3B TaxID=2886941 RepID=UPI001D0FFB7C|nr:hypothetical protein [Hymenobacter sp. 15J16-1T3B]MCC3158321.1 hypothetical protein [Hymenobacter sp. 15J16-1T3B]